MEISKMWKSDELLKAAMTSQAKFRGKLRDILTEIGLNIRDFCEKADIPENTLYKIASEDRDIRVSTLRTIYQTIKKLEGREETSFIALITTRNVLDSIKQRDFKINEEEIMLRDYPAITIEEVIRSAVRAEKDGAKAIICGPIAATTIEKIVDIPVAAIVLEKGVDDAISAIIRKIT